MLATDPVPGRGTEVALELAVLRGLVDAVPLPPADLPGWQSLTAAEYARAVGRLRDRVAAASAALAAAGGAS